MDDCLTEHESVPAYLIPTNRTFHRLVEKVRQAASSIDLDALRRIAILKHQIGDLHISKQISLIYLRSGKGELRQPGPEITPVDRCVWPAQVKSAMLAAKPAIDEGDEHLAYVNLVHQRIRQMEEKIQQYQRQLDEAKQSLFGLTPTMDEAIESFVQEHGIRPLEMKRDLKIALLEHDYDAKIVERQYARENPNEYQVRIAETSRDHVIPFRFKWPSVSMRLNTKWKDTNKKWSNWRCESSSISHLAPSDRTTVKKYHR